MIHRERIIEPIQRDLSLVGLPHASMAMLCLRGRPAVHEMHMRVEGQFFAFGERKNDEI